MKERELPPFALRAFAVAARTSSLTAAAKQLRVMHGAISKQVNALERWLGQRLFAREGARIGADALRPSPRRASSDKP